MCARVFSRSHGRGPTGPVDAVRVDVIDHRVVQQVLDALATAQGSTYPRRGYLVRYVLRHDLNVVLKVFRAKLVNEPEVERRFGAEGSLLAGDVCLPSAWRGYPSRR